MKYYFFILLLISVINSKAQESNLEDKFEFTPTLGYEFNSNYNFRSATHLLDNNIHEFPASLRWGGLGQIKENNFYGSVSMEFMTDISEMETYQGYLDVNMDYKILKKDPLYIQVAYESIIPYGSNVFDLESSMYMAGIHYNNIINNRNQNETFNFYTQADYIFQGYQGYRDNRDIQADFSNSIRTIFGAILNIKDIVFFEQNAIIYTEPSDLLNMAPFFSKFESIAWVQLGEWKLKYYHICYHTFITNKKLFTRISGEKDRFSIAYTINLKN